MPNSKKIKLLFVYQDLGTGGAEIVLASTVKNIDKKRYEINICCIGKEGNISGELKKIGCNVIILNRRYILRDIFTTFALYKVIKKCNPDIIHTSLFYANYHGRIAAKLAGVPVIISEEQCVDSWKDKYYIFVIIDNILSYFTDSIIACSETVRDFTVKQEKIALDKFSVIYNTFDADRLNPVNLNKIELNSKMGFLPEDIIIGSIGRLCEQKGHSYLIDAIAEVVKKIPNVKLLIVGEGPLEPKLKAKVNRMNLNSTVFFMKKRYDINHLLELFDIFILPSLWEGLSVVLLEAMYMGRPVIVSDISSNREVVVNNETGLLVPPADYNALSQKIISLLNDKTKRERIGLAAKKSVSGRFNTNTRVMELSDLYEKEMRKKDI
jgi:glycosyltransferase involved in cell wall biosynthesis